MGTADRGRPRRCRRRGARTLGIPELQGVRAGSGSHHRAGARGLYRCEGAHAMKSHQEQTSASSGDYAREAEATRHRLAGSLNELSARMTPGQVYDEMMTYTKGGGGTCVRALT